MRRNTYTGVLDVQADCRDCDWSSEARNALANAARHADAHPDHEVNVEQVLGVTYNRKTDEEVLEAGRRCAETGPHSPHSRAVWVRREMVQAECPGVPS